MHPDNKLTNHGKQVSSESRSHIPIVNHQGVPGHLGPKVVGGNGVKTCQISPGSHALKSVSQSVSSAGGMLKTKTKRERSISMDSDEKNVRTSVESDAKGEGIMRSKRRCVLERKQPYSGDEWCSGPDTEEDEEKPHTLFHRELAMAAPAQGLYDLQSDPGPGLEVEPKQSLKQLVYVFTTNLANSAADAVLKGQSDSILLFHQQNVPCSKLEQGLPARKKTSNMTEKVRSSSSPPNSTPKSQSGTPRPSSAGVMGMTLRVGTPPPLEQSSEITRTRTSQESHNKDFAKIEAGCLPADLIRATRDGEAVGGMVTPISTVPPSQSPTLQSTHPQRAQASRLCPESLSKEQLEHRERSLQTLRDIERLFLRSATNAGPDPESFSNNPNNPPSVTERIGILDGSGDGRIIPGSNNALSSTAMGNIRKYEEPLQSIISQTESLRPPRIEHHHIDNPHRQMSPSGMDIGHLLGPEGLTPEQIAWRKLQEEYYQEKRRQQEIQPPIHSENYRVSEIGMMRGPPPPYHSKAGEQQWANNMIGGGVRGNTHILDIPEGHQGPKFLGQISRVPPGGGFPGSPGPFPLEGVGQQRPIRPGMLWVDEMPNNKGPGGPFQGLYAGGPPQHLQGHTESSNDLIAREEIFHILEKRQMQGLPRSELIRLAKELQYNLQRPNRLIRRGTISSQNDPMDFPGSQVILGSPGVGPQIKDLVDAPLGNNIPLNMKSSINVQQHQQLNLTPKLRGSLEVGSLSGIYGPAAMSQARNSQNRREENRGFNPRPDAPFHFPNQGPFTGRHVEGPYLQTDSEMFEDQAPNQIGGTMRLSHMAMPQGFKGPEGRSRHPSDPTMTLNPVSSQSLPSPHQLNSPSIDQAPSPLLPSSSGARIKSPSQIASGAHQPSLPSASGPGTPSSTKSPQMVGTSNHGLHSPSISPGQLKSPTGPAGSPGWTSPKSALPSPGPASGKMVGKGGPSVETGQSVPTRSSTPISQPGSTNTSVPFTSSPDAPPSQNPLSLIMSQMSKYAMPSSTPLYHEAIKTLGSSDDEILPDRPLLSGVCIGGNIGNTQASHLLDPEPQSPLDVLSHGQQHLSHEASGPMLSSPNQMALSSMNSVMIGAGAPPDGIVASLSQNQLGGFSRVQSHGPLNSPVGVMVQNFSQSSDNILTPQQLHMINKGHQHQRNQPQDSFSSLPLGDGPDLSEVIRPTRTGIPEFDLSRIIPCDKPSSILQYFPKSHSSHQNQSQGLPSQHGSSQQLLKQLSSTISHGSGPSSNPHIANLQNMMAEQQLQPLSHSAGRQGMGVSRAMVTSAGIGAMCPPGHIMGRPAMSLQQHSIIHNNPLHHSTNPYHNMMPSQQHSHNTMAQHNMMMMMQTKQQGLGIPGDAFGPQGPLMSPQGPVMGLPQPGMMGPQSVRQRGTPLDSPIGYGPGGMANIPY